MLSSPVLGRGEGQRARGGRSAAGRNSRQSVAGRRAAHSRHARPLAYYVPPRPPASLHGGRRSDVPTSALLGTGGYNILTTNPYVINNDHINRCCELLSLTYASAARVFSGRTDFAVRSMDARDCYVVGWIRYRSQGTVKMTKIKKI